MCSDYMPNITVLMPVYNGGSYLPVAVKSIIDQTYREFELLVVDDGSDDGATQRLTEMNDLRIRVLFRPRLGVGAALQYGLEQCRTSYIARMDSDDISSSTRLRTQLTFLENHPEVGAVGTQFKYFVGDRSPAPPQSVPLMHKQIVANLMKGSMGLVAASMMFRTEQLLRCGGYRVQGVGEDWDMFLRLCEVTTVANLSEVLYWWRLHSGNLNYRKTMTEQFAIKHAITCATARATDRTEVSFDQYLAAQSPYRRCLSAIQSRGLVHYRKALCDFALNRPLTAYWRLFLAALVCPQRAVRRIARYS